jgi:hypothetical protein
MTKCKLPESGSLGQVTYSIHGLTSDNIGNGIDAIHLAGGTAQMKGVTNIQMTDMAGNPIEGASLAVSGTYTCA